MKISYVTNIENIEISDGHKISKQQSAYAGKIWPIQQYCKSSSKTIAFKVESHRCNATIETLSNEDIRGSITAPI